MELAWRRPWLARRVLDRGAARDPRSIRTFSTLTLLLVVALTLAAVAILAGTSHAMRAGTREAIAAAESQALIASAQVSLLTHRRLSNLWSLTHDASLEQARDEEAAKALSALERAAGNTENRHERALTELAGRQIVAYLEQRRRLEAQTDDLPTLARELRPYFDDASDTLTRLQELHEQDVREANARIGRAVLLTDVLGVLLAALLIGAFVTTLWAVRRWIVHPLLGLHGVIERFRDGEIAARAPPEGAREMREVAHAYNAMADTIAAQREGQLAYLAGVAHDLRNPLGAMKTGITLVECNEATERARHTLALLDRQTDRMARMVDDLLDATLIESGRLQMRPEPFDLVERARDCVALHGPAFPAHTITLDVPERPVIVHADPLRLDQVITNLLTNALKFSPAGGRVDVRVARREREALIEVRDQGIGMTPEAMRHLFAPFRRSAPDVAPGVGLGLSVVRRIVEAHGGRVEVESQPNAGSTFRVILPLEQASEQ